ncbi:MAG TPA: hypothetical protein VGZ27_00335 [Vicinamibacterales bacterium]|jgi:hypothetical protein|nr:hypothetical protein [Vicinamibacterales bacterium]
MSKKRFAVMLDVDVLAQLNEVKERLGLPVSEQIHRGVRSWLDSTEWPERRSEAAPAPMTDTARHPH